MWLSAEESPDVFFGTRCYQETEILREIRDFLSEDDEQLIVMIVPLIQSIDDDDNRSIGKQAIGWT